MKKQSRRKFVETAAGSLALLPLIHLPDLETKPKKMKRIFVHQVYFWLNNPGSEADKAKLVEGLNMLTDIKTIQDYHIGVPAASSRDVVDGSYSISWLTTFKDKAAQDEYQVDPIHLRFVEEYKHLWTKVVVYDSIDA
jgi:hypothetical protein